MYSAFKKGKKTSIAIMLTILVVAIIPVLSMIPHRVEAQEAQLLVLPAENNFFTDSSPPGSSFVVNVTVLDVNQLANWQTFLTFDPTMLNFTKATIPADNVFSQSGQALLPVPAVVDNGTVLFGATYLDTSIWTFNGTGTLCQFNFTILTPPGLLPETSNLNLTTGGAFDTFLLDGTLIDIAFSMVGSTFTYSAVVNSLAVGLTPQSKNIDVFDVVTFTASVTNGTAPYSNRWDIDGVEYPAAENATTWDVKFNQSDTRYNVRVNVTDSLGAIGSNQSAITTATMTMTINPAGPLATDVGTPVTFDVTIAHGAAPFDISWFLNGTLIPEAANLTSHPITFNAPGAWTVQVTVAGTDGKSVSTEVDITVLPTAVTVVSVTPVTGLTFDSDAKTIGDKIVYNITVQDVQLLDTWQANVTWDGTLLNLTNPSTDLIIPTDNVFAGSTVAPVLPPKVIGPGFAAFGASSTLDPNGFTFNGTGVLMQITLTIIRQPNDPSSSCTIDLQGKYVNTFLVAGPVTIPINISSSTYTYNLIKTVTHTVGAFTVTTFSNASILSNNVTQLGDGSIAFNVNGASETGYFVNTTIPQGLLTGINKVIVNGVDVSNQATITTGGTDTFVYYSSTFGASSTSSTINIIPEGILLLLMAGMIASVISVAFIRASKRKMTQ